MTQHPADTVRAVVDVLADEMERASAAALNRIAGEILDAIVEDPVATRHQDGTVTLQWPSTAGHAALVSRELLELLVVDANRVRAGSEPLPLDDHPVVQLTLGQWWAWLLDMEHHARVETLTRLRMAADEGHMCWQTQHRERLERGEQRVRDLEAENDTLRRTLAALRGPLAPLVDRTPTPPPETPTAALPLPNGLCTGRRDCPAADHIEGCYAHPCTGTRDCPATAHVRGCYFDPAATPTQESTR